MNQESPLLSQPNTQHYKQAILMIVILLVVIVIAAILYFFKQSSGNLSTTPIAEPDKYAALKMAQLEQIANETPVQLTAEEAAIKNSLLKEMEVNNSKAQVMTAEQIEIKEQLLRSLNKN